MDKPQPFDHVPEVLDEQACLFLLQSRDLGRIAFNIEGREEIFPVNYAVEGRIIVFRTAPGTKLKAVPNLPLAFEVDSWDPKLAVGWSVVVKGEAEEISTNPGRTAEHLRRTLARPAAPGERWHWLAIMPSEISGRRFHVPTPRGERT
ncbi:MAG TPA: pyridoxamine 5'-phosphate oxidase family protein [Candidatus Dormibacteraeota bacterium]|nr:pyridoxamine 5'-phosphate oxidase family protein [Candidatus Dormibacteraeota bacterium]